MRILQHSVASPRIEIFRPYVLTRERKPNIPAVLFEGRILSDLTMPERDWKRFDAPAEDRLPARSVCAAEFGS